MAKVIVTRFVSMNEPHNHLGRNANAGEEFFTFHQPTYGCVDDRNGIALSVIDGDYPFFEFPRDAVEAA